MECLFCNIANKKISAKIIAENQGAIAFLDVKPLADGHTIVIPKKHYANLSSCSKTDLVYVMELVHDVANILLDSKLQPWGFNYLSNEGNIAGQEIMHFHIHVIPKYGKDEGFKIGVGTRYVDDVDNVYKSLSKPIRKFND